MSSATFPRSAWLLLAALTVGWGLNWPMIKLAVNEIPPLSFRAACLYGGALGLFSIAASRGLPLALPRGVRWRLTAIALCGITAWNILTAYGIGYMSSGRAGILGFTMPVWGVLLGALVLGEPITPRRVLGLVLGMSAMALLLVNEWQALRAAPVGTLLMLSAAFFWASGTVLMKRLPVDLPPTVFTAWQLTIAGIPVLAAALAFDLPKLHPVGPGALVGLFYNMIVAFIFCHWAFVKIVAMVPVGISSLSVLLVPVVGVFGGMVLLGETPHWQDYAALALVFAALATVLLPPGAITSFFRKKAA